VFIRVIPRHGEDKELLDNDLKIMRTFQHDNMRTLLDVYLDDDNIYLVLEFFKGDELFELISEKMNFHEKEAVSIVKQIAKALQFLHKNGVTHRDFKPENILVSGDKDHMLKIPEFDLVRDVTKTTTTNEIEYLAPEVLRELTNFTFDHPVDMWALGVLTYRLLIGSSPFPTRDLEKKKDKILNANFDTTAHEWEKLTPKAKDFITNLLKVNPNERLTAEDCVNHPWLSGTSNSTFKPVVSTRKEKNLDEEFDEKHQEHLKKRKESNTNSPSIKKKD